MKPLPTIDQLLVPISMVKEDPDQPRRIFDKAALEELAADIKNRGIQHPIIVRKNGAGYIIKDGGRRYRAALLAKSKAVPVIVDAREQTAIERAADQIAVNDERLRKGLNPIELAEHLAKLQREQKMTPNAIADMYSKIGKPISRPTISNIIRLATLPDWAKTMIREGKLSASHGKYLLQVDKPDVLERLRNAIQAKLRAGESITVEELSTVVDGLTGHRKTERPRAASKKREERRAATKPAAKPAATVPEPETFKLEPTLPPPAKASTDPHEPSEEQAPLPQLPPGVTSFNLLARFLVNAAKVQIALSSQGAGDFQAVLVPTLRKLPDRASAELKRVWNKFACPIVLRGELATMDAELAQHLHQVLEERAAIKDEGVVTGDGSGKTLPPFDANVEREAPAAPTANPTEEPA